VRALTSGCVVVACPVAGDMNENAARLAWAGAGVRIPRRFISAGPLRLAVGRAVSEPGLRARTQELAAWAASHDAGARAAELLEELVERR
jgi:UDP:flavonoid glycosyltransferase YjiC (YdhE family)